MEIPIFPLGTVLFPGGLLPLRIFEQRYLEMTKACIRDGTGFGVCLIREGREVGDPAVPFPIGCTARIEHWEMPHLGLFQLLCRGEQVFRLVEQWTAKNGLMHAVVSLREPPPAQPLPAADQPLAALLQRIIDQVGAQNFPAPLALDDADWVCWRLAEILPLPMASKQRLLELEDREARLALLREALRSWSAANSAE